MIPKSTKAKIRSVLAVHLHSPHYVGARSQYQGSGDSAWAKSRNSLECQGMPLAALFPNTGTEILREVLEAPLLLVSSVGSRASRG